MGIKIIFCLGFINGEVLILLAEGWEGLGWVDHRHQICYFSVQYVIFVRPGCCDAYIITFSDVLAPNKTILFTRAIAKTIKYIQKQQISVSFMNDQITLFPLPCMLFTFVFLETLEEHGRLYLSPPWISLTRTMCFVEGG